MRDFNDLDIIKIVESVVMLPPITKSYVSNDITSLHYFRDINDFDIL